MPSAATAAIEAGSAVVGGIVQGQAADAANKAAQQASQANIQLANQVYGQTTNNLNPFIQGGQTATNETLGLLGLGGNPQAAKNAFDQFRNSTNYNFLLNQGLQGVQSANAQSFNSGATMKALNNYAQGMAGNALTGYFGQLNNLSGQGLSGAGTLGSLGQNYVQQVGGFRNNAATAAATDATRQGNAFTNALGGVVNAVGPSLSSYIGGLGNGFTQPNASAVNTGAYNQSVVPSSFDTSGFIPASNQAFMTAQPNLPEMTFPNTAPMGYNG